MVREKTEVFVRKNRKSLEEIAERSSPSAKRIAQAALSLVPEKESINHEHGEKRNKDR